MGITQVYGETTGNYSRTIKRAKTKRNVNGRLREATAEQ